MVEILEGNLMITVEKEDRMHYNGLRKPGMFDTSVILNLHYFKRDAYISVLCHASVSLWKTEKQMRLPTWRKLGVKIQKPAFWGIYQRWTA